MDEFLVITIGCIPLTVDFPLPVAPMTLWQRLECGFNSEWVVRYVRDPDGWGRGRLMLAHAGFVSWGRGAVEVSNHLIVAKIVRISDLEPDCPSELLPSEDISERERPNRKGCVAVLSGTKHPRTERM